MPAHDFLDRPHSPVVVFESLPDVSGVSGASIPALKNGSGDREEEKASLQRQDEKTSDDQSHRASQVKVYSLPPRGTLLPVSPCGSSPRPLSPEWSGVSSL